MPFQIVRNDITCMAVDAIVNTANLLRHHPDELQVDMDIHGYVDVECVIDRINKQGRYHLSRSQLVNVVANDEKGRYRYSKDGLTIKACQGHSIPWVKPELVVMAPPEYLYHGTTAEALEQILKSGAVLKMQRHAVHVQADPGKAWKSASRWKGKNPVVLKIAAEEMATQGYEFGKIENDI